MDPLARARGTRGRNIEEHVAAAPKRTLLEARHVRAALSSRGSYHRPDLAKLPLPKGEWGMCCVEVDSERAHRNFLEHRWLVD
jgi:hypothetical protein